MLSVFAWGAAAGILPRLLERKGSCRSFGVCMRKVDVEEKGLEHLALEEGRRANLEWLAGVNHLSLIPPGPSFRSTVSL